MFMRPNRSRSVALIVGALLASVSPAAMAQSPEPEVSAPVEVTATGVAGDCVEGTVETVGRVVRSRDGYCNPVWTWSDPRLNGKVTISLNNDEYLDGNVSIGSFAYLTENDEGAWRSRPVPVIEVPGKITTREGTWVLDGEGAYEGLVAVLSITDYYTPQGYIIEGDLPPAPDIASPK
jgi:hypothetical protein